MNATVRRVGLALLTALLPGLVGVVVFQAVAANAASGCGVTYSIGSQWSGGFTATVSVTNLGDALSSWTLKWSFGAGQTVTQAWSAVVTQSGTAVTATNAGWNGALAGGASTSFGFNASWTTSNPAPTGFTLNGITCTGAVSTSPTPTTTSATPTPTATSDPWDPPSDLTTPLDEVWQHEVSTYTDLYGFKNYIWDQLMAAKGSINYCVRWDSSASVTAAQRDQVQTTLARQFQKWIDQLQENGQGWDGFPYATVPVKVVGWAVRDRSQLQWSDSSVDVTVNNINEDAPQCNPACARFFHQDNDYSGCPGGAAHHYDLSLWLTAGMTGGAGGDWGERIGSEYYMSNLSTDNVHILLHEMGHGYGLDDFYDWTPPGGPCCFIMNAGTATYITEFDKWMLRDFWRHLKSRYGL
jgi:hypothetical protein